MDTNGNKIFAVDAANSVTGNYSATPNQYFIERKGIKP